MPKSKYTEHEKLKALGESREAVQELLDWLGDDGIHLAKRHAHEDGCYNGDGELDCAARQEELIDHYETKEKLMARFFEIDLDKLENEKRAMLDEIRASSAR